MRRPKSLINGGNLLITYLKRDMMLSRQLLTLEKLKDVQDNCLLIIFKKTAGNMLEFGGFRSQENAYVSSFDEKKHNGNGPHTVSCFFSAKN